MEKLHDGGTWENLMETTFHSNSVLYLLLELAPRKKLLTSIMRETSSNQLTAGEEEYLTHVVLKETDL